jgi:hypothetical protein
MLRKLDTKAELVPHITRVLRALFAGDENGYLR